MSQNFTFGSREEYRANLPELLADLQARIANEGGCVVNVQAIDQHSEEQRKRLNAACGDLERQIRLTEDGRYVHVSEAPFGKKLSKDDWRGMFMAVLHGMRSVPNPEGPGFIVLSRSSQRLSRKKFQDAITLINAFGDQRGVSWTDPKWISLMKSLQEAA
ncbi:MAG: recombination protein NinB [Sinimarinibacterium flocculans]|uniref:recombination protein NinB n=1 Tax=Sinimarinibacterium flocculans TaxID=985250 RepID=UPI003C58F4DA